MKHTFEYRVPYADTDQMGVVYYANYFRYFEQSRTEMLRALGVPYSEMERLGFFLMVSEAQCRYLSPAHYDELLECVTWVSARRAASLVLDTEIYHSGKLLASGHVTLASVDAQRRIIRLPELLSKLRVHSEK